MDFAERGVFVIRSVGGALLDGGKVMGSLETSGGRGGMGFMLRTLCIWEGG